MASHGLLPTHTNKFTLGQVPSRQELRHPGYLHHVTLPAGSMQGFQVTMEGKTELECCTQGSVSVPLPATGQGLPHKSPQLQGGWEMRRSTQISEGKSMSLPQCCMRQVAL